MPPLPPRGLRERWRLSRARRQAPHAAGPIPLAELGDHPLAVALRAAWPFLSSLEGAPSPLGLARTLGAVLQGPLHAAGGEAALAALVRRRIAESRGELLGGEGEPAPAPRLEIAGGKAQTLTVKGGEARYTARAFILAGAPGAPGTFLGGHEKLLRWLEPAAPAARVLSIAWVVRADALPAPLGEVAVALPEDGGPVLLQALPAVHAGHRAHEPSPTERLLVAGTPGPPGADAAAGTAARLRRAVSAFLPFLDRATVHEAEIFRRPGAPAFHALLPALPDRVLGVGGISTASPVGNLFLAGREVLPGLGLEGQFHAAWQAADAVERVLGKRSRPK
jgi:hypothetical protein